MEIIYLKYTMEGKILKNYIKKQNKNHTLSKITIQIFLIFAIATTSIILYDMYINIEIEDSTSYSANKVAKETSTENTDDVSTMLTNASKSVVRNI